MSLVPTTRLTIPLSRAKGTPRLRERVWSGSKINSHNLDIISEPNVFVQLHHDEIKC
jgi:hypothetical protein